MEPETVKIVENIRKKRLEKKISLLKLANDTAISHSHLYYIESKRVVPSIDVVVKIAKSLHVTLSELAEKAEA
jgi:transcriptional regulator with XRE-family HTH domain